MDKIRGDKPLREHGVTAAEQFKLLPLTVFYTGDQEGIGTGQISRIIKVETGQPDA